MNKKWLLVKEAAKKTRYSGKQIRKLIEHDRIEFEKRDGHIYVNYFDLKRYEENHPETKQSSVWGEIKVLKDENFIPVEGYDNKYMISNKGRLINATNGQALTPATRKDGYSTFSLRKNENTKTVYVQNLVAEHFCKNYRKITLPNEKWEIHHINTQRSNNNSYNLLWVTKKEHTDLHKLWKSGEKREYWEKVDQIIALNETGLELFKIPNDEYENSETYNYWLWVDEKGKQAYEEGREIPLTSIKMEYAEAIA